MSSTKDAAMEKAVALHGEIQPILRGIYGHLYAVLPSDRDRELLGMYNVLEMGSILSVFAPAELIGNEYMMIFDTWKGKAAELLRALENVKPTDGKATRRKTQNKAIPVTLEGTE